MATRARAQRKPCQWTEGCTQSAVGDNRLCSKHASLTLKALRESSDYRPLIGVRPDTLITLADPY